MKCNVDASYHVRDRTGATGMVLRDHEGRTSDGKVRWYEHCLNALAAEAMACHDGMQYAREHGVQRLPLEIDCHVLVTL
jgi:ribonuclease HI